jgi:hypothetical protein
MWLLPGKKYFFETKKVLFLNFPNDSFFFSEWLCPELHVGWFIFGIGNIFLVLWTFLWFMKTRPHYEMARRVTNTWCRQPKLMLGVGVGVWSMVYEYQRISLIRSGDFGLLVCRTIHQRVWCWFIGVWYFLAFPLACILFKKLSWHSECAYAWILSNMAIALWRNNFLSKW